MFQITFYHQRNSFTVEFSSRNLSTRMLCEIEPKASDRSMVAAATFLFSFILLRMFSEAYNRASEEEYLLRKPN